MLILCKGVCQMNRIYKTLWSRTKGCEVVVPEIAKNHGEVGIVNHKVGGGGGEPSQNNCISSTIGRECFFF